MKRFVLMLSVLTSVSAFADGGFDGLRTNDIRNLYKRSAAATVEALKIGNVRNCLYFDSFDRDENGNVFMPSGFQLAFEKTKRDTSQGKPSRSGVTVGFQAWGCGPDICIITDEVTMTKQGRYDAVLNRDGRPHAYLRSTENNDLIVEIVDESSGIKYAVSNDTMYAWAYIVCPLVR